MTTLYNANNASNSHTVMKTFDFKQSFKYGVWENAPETDKLFAIIGVKCNEVAVKEY